MEEQHNQVSQAPQQTVIPQTQAPRSHMLIIVLVGLLMLGIGLGGGYIFFANKTPQVSQTNTQSLPPTANPSITMAVPANWQEYTNAKYGFSLKVDPDFEHSLDQNVNANNNGGIKSLDQDGFYKGSTVGAGFKGEALQILIYPQTGNEESLDYGETQRGPDDIVSTVTINGSNVKKIVSVHFGNVFIGPIIHNGYVYNFVIHGSTEESTYESVYTMLSTFKFTN